MPATSGSATARRNVRARSVSPSAPSAGSGRKGFGAASRDSGHSRAPAPPERMIGTNAIGGVRVLEIVLRPRGLYPSGVVLTDRRRADTVSTSGEATVSDQSPDAIKLVRHFRQILLWPLQLQPIRSGAQIQEPWDILKRASANNPWSESRDEFSCDPAQFQERHYSEFVTFLPYVRSFLYGEGKAASAMAAMESPIRVFRRTDVAKVRMHAHLGHVGATEHPDRRLHGRHRAGSLAFAVQKAPHVGKKGDELAVVSFLKLRRIATEFVPRLRPRIV